MFGLLGFAVVAVHGYLTPKTWQASTVARIEPLVVPDLQIDREDPSAPTGPGEYLEAELATARSEDFEAPFLDDLDFPARIEVEREPGGATLRFTARADSAERAVNASYSAANGYLAWGRTVAARNRAVALADELERLDPVDPRRPVAAAELARAEAAIDQVGNEGGTVVVEPIVPDEPVAPDLALRLVAATAVGLVVGVLVLWGRSRRTPSTGPALDPGPAATSATAERGPAGTALLVVSAVAPVLLFAAVTAGVVGLWELRPTTNRADEEGYLCLHFWTYAIPDGTVVGIADDAPRFFRDHLQEFTFPRLLRATADREADAVLHLEPGPGAQSCAGYHVRWEGEAPWVEASADVQPESEAQP